VEDARALAEAERATAETPGLLVSRPAELTDERFAPDLGHQRHRIGLNAGHRR